MTNDIIRLRKEDPDMAEDQTLPLHIRKPGMCKPFELGSNHNPHGRPKGRNLTQELVAFGKQAINKSGDKSYLQALVESTWKRAVAGDRHCARLIFERLSPALQANITAQVSERVDASDVLEMLGKLKAATGFLDDEGPPLLEAETT